MLFSASLSIFESVLSPVPPDGFRYGVLVALVHVFLIPLLHSFSFVLGMGMGISLQATIHVYQVRKAGMIGLVDERCGRRVRL